MPDSLSYFLFLFSINDGSILPSFQNNENVRFTASTVLAPSDGNMVAVTGGILFHNHNNYSFKVQFLRGMEETVK